MKPASSDTTSNVADFGYPAQSNPDQILEDKSFELFAPIYQINTINSMVPTSPPRTWEDLKSPNRLFSYGVRFLVNGFGVRSKIKFSSQKLQAT
ncbi:hypothetical protein PSHT_12501 [Puccinia striiformis]|uniref:Uncharacterized protein n=1 Tax=Puccinia striiformis TaxID=27350 RepID=A0A2S4UW95_9BASI|nr:hypothetical protein PSHT_12501 [Puccinia striiformis]